MRNEVISKIMKMIENDEDFYTFAYENNIECSEIWSDDDEEIIGVQIEDETVYFE